MGEKRKKELEEMGEKLKSLGETNAPAIAFKKGCPGFKYGGTACKMYRNRKKNRKICIPCIDSIESIRPRKSIDEIVSERGLTVIG